jgi:hypothetical protein
MHRLIAIAMLLVLGLAAAAPVLAAQSDSSHIAACCRRNGAHQCSGMAKTAASETPIFRASCSAFPHAPAATQAGVWSVAIFSRSETRLTSLPTLLGQVEAGYRIALDRSRHKRGPPSLLA